MARVVGFLRIVNDHDNDFALLLAIVVVVVIVIDTYDTHPYG